MDLLHSWGHKLLFQICWHSAVIAASPASFISYIGSSSTPVALFPFTSHRAFRTSLLITNGFCVYFFSWNSIEEFGSPM